MARRRLDACYLSGTDPHRSEYLCEHWQLRRWFTGFTGSSGELVVTPGEALLWTDSRYFLQAVEELRGTGVRMMKARVPGAITPAEWLSAALPAGSTLGVDYLSLPLETFRQFHQASERCPFTMTDLAEAIGEAWPGRPPLPGQPLYEMDADLAGQSRLSKLERISEILKQKGAHLALVTALDDLAWTFNLRGNDIPYNPLFMGFALVGPEGNRLFAGRNLLPSALAEKLAGEGVELLDYGGFISFLSALEGKNICLDPVTVNTAVWKALSGKNNILEMPSIPGALKAVKNGAELEGFRLAARKDGVALVLFLEWLNCHAGEPGVTEYTAARKLDAFRAMQAGYRGESFAPLTGVGEHGAMVHLSVSASNALPLTRQGLLLFDSGGHYNHGTTDVTRTVSLGRVNPVHKRDFTLVLKGLIALSRALFPEGTRGCQLDVLARQFLWENGLDYGHGTGHGIGHLLSVHEPPVSIRKDYNPTILAAGMVLSNEPGIYRQGEYGIRLENMMVCMAAAQTDYGTFLGFETLTLCPFDLTLVDRTLLTSGEKEWLNLYHRRVRKELLPLLPDKTARFLQLLTEEL